MRGADAKNVKGVAAHEYRMCELRVAVDREAQTSAPRDSSNAIEDVGPLCVLLVVRIRAGPGPDDHSFRIPHVERPEERGIRKREHSRVGADAQRQRNDRRSSERRAAKKEPRAMLDIPCEVAHVFSG